MKGLHKPLSLKKNAKGKALPKKELSFNDIKARSTIISAFYYDHERYKKTSQTIISYLTMLLSMGHATEKSLGHYTRLVYKPINLPRSAVLSGDVRVAVRPSHKRTLAPVLSTTYHAMSLSFDSPSDEAYVAAAFSSLEREIRTINGLYGELIKNSFTLTTWFTDPGIYIDRKVIVRPYAVHEKYYMKKRFELVEVSVQNATFILVREAGIFTMIISKDKAEEWMK